MKTTFPAVTACLLAASIAFAEPLTEPTPIRSKPDAAAPIIGLLKAGTDPVASTGGTAPAGWLAVDVPGPHEAYVFNNDVGKNLDIRAGAAIRLKPKADAPVLAIMHEGDKTDITGMLHSWMQIKLYKTVVGYIRTGGAAGMPGAARAPASPSDLPAAQPPTPPPVAGPAAGLPRSIQGMLVETKRFLLVGRRPDYDYQLNDSTGKRIGFLDVSKIAQLQKIGSYVDQLVTVSGVVQQTGDGSDLVIVLQTIETR